MQHHVFGIPESQPKSVDGRLSVHFEYYLPRPTTFCMTPEHRGNPESIAQSEGSDPALQPEFLPIPGQSRDLLKRFPKEQSRKNRRYQRQIPLQQSIRQR